VFFVRGGQYRALEHCSNREENEGGESYFFVRDGQYRALEHCGSREENEGVKVTVAMNTGPGPDASPPRHSLR
jgi:hypothetical protein